MATGKVCSKCQKRKPAIGFRQTRVDGKLTRIDICVVCEALDEETGDVAALKSEVAARKAEREAEKQKQRAEKRKDVQRVAAAKYNLEQRRLQQRIRNAEKRREKLEQDEAAKAELARRVLARRHLIHFILRFHTRYMAGWVHHLICRKLEKFVQDVRAGLSPRLMLFMPPRAGKSEIASNNFPAWLLGNHPEMEVIAASYGSSLPQRFSRRVRGMLRDNAYQQIFKETRLDPENESVDGWSTTKGGGYIPAGVGGGITGKGADVLIIDDPFKDAEEADSETIRQNVWDWYDSTAETRLSPTSGVLIILTRWHDDDLAGRLLAQEKHLTEENEEALAATMEALEARKGEMATSAYVEALQAAEARYEQGQREIPHWEVVSFPALAEGDEYLDEHDTLHVVDPKSNLLDFDLGRASLLRKKGAALHPERYDETYLRRKRKTMQTRFWSALYQQNPVPDEGVFFKKSMFRLLPFPDYRGWRIFSAWDLAIGKKQMNDWTVGVIGALDYDDNLWVLDMLRARWDTFGIVEAILDSAKKYGVETIGIERGQLQLAVWPQLEKRMKERRQTSLAFDEELKPITDKAARARPLQGRMQQGMVILPEGQPWVETYMHELLRFPGAKWDDIVDASAWLARMALRQTAPLLPRSKRHRSWRDKINQQMESRHPMAA